MTINRWEYKSSFAYMSEEFGQNLAMKKFNLSFEDLEKICGKYQRGKRKGKLKGTLVWFKIIKGGWVKTGPYDFEQMRACGFVVAPGRCFGFAIVNDWASDNEKWVLFCPPETSVDEERKCIDPVQSLIRGAK